MKFKFLLILFFSLFGFFNAIVYPVSAACLKIECAGVNYEFENLEINSLSSLRFLYNEPGSFPGKTPKLINFYLLLLRDWNQTLKINENPKLYEKNKILGENPRNINIHLYFATSSLLFSWLALNLPEPHDINFIESVSKTQEIITKNNETLINGGKNGKYLSFVLVYTFKF